MSFEILHFNGADKVLKKKKMEKDVQSTLEYIDDALYGTLQRGVLLRQALTEMDWRHESYSILEGRRYYYKGFKNGVAIDGNFASYEYILDGLFRLQIGFDKGKIEAGLLLLTSERSEKTPYGSTRKLVEEEVKLLYPTISVPVTVALFDLGKPGIFVEEESFTDNKKDKDQHEGQDKDVKKGSPAKSKEKTPSKSKNPPTQDQVS